MNIFIQILLIAIAAICKAAVDTIVFHNGGKLPKTAFWDNNKQGKYLPLTKYPWDGKHVLNSVMIVCFVFSETMGTWGTWVWIAPLQVLSLGIIFILVFNLFWNKIFN